MKMTNSQIEDMLGTNKPCPDLSEEHSLESGSEYVLKTKGVAKVDLLPLANEFKGTKSLFIISEQAYKYFLSKCTEDELWDLGILGCSEEHVRSSEHVLPLR